MRVSVIGKPIASSSGRCIPYKTHNIHGLAVFFPTMPSGTFGRTAKVWTPISLRGVGPMYDIREEEGRTCLGWCSVTAPSGFRVSLTPLPCAPRGYPQTGQEEGVSGGPLMAPREVPSRRPDRQAQGRGEREAWAWANKGKTWANGIYGLGIQWGWMNTSHRLAKAWQEKTSFVCRGGQRWQDVYSREMSLYMEIWPQREQYIFLLIQFLSFS